MIEIPAELELLDFFESETIDSRPSDGYWCYEVYDNDGVGLRLSFNIFEHSVQTIITHKSEVLCTVSRENAVVIRIEKSGELKNMIVDFKTKCTKGSLTLSWKNGIKCEWWDLAC